MNGPPATTAAVRTAGPSPSAWHTLSVHQAAMLLRTSVEVGLTAGELWLELELGGPPFEWVLN